jgi:hypothetical protein
MSYKSIYRRTAILILFASAFIGVSIGGCRSVQIETATPNTPEISEVPPILPTRSRISPVATEQTSPTPNLSGYAFPDSIDPAKQYLFYLHGKIIENQGIPAISPDYGEYEYEAILEKLSRYGFVVISEQRHKNADGVKYARIYSKQVTTLLDAGVPAKNITVVGASKGAGIAIYVSHFLENEEINYVLLGICHPDVVEALKRDQIHLFGNILAIYDSTDEYAGSCQELFSFSEGKGISRHDEIVLEIGTGHGVLYQPLDAWIIPTVEWAGKP